MANSSDPFTESVHGTNPQYLVEKITRLKIYNCIYWKEECFGLTAESLIDKAIALKYCGGTYGGSSQPSKFLCLVLKLLQLQPEKEIILQFIENDDFKYLRALGAFYLRLVGKAEDIYNFLEPLYSDYRKLAYRGQIAGASKSGWSVIHMDTFIDSLLNDELVCSIALPHIPKRIKLEDLHVLDPRESTLEIESEEEEDEVENNENVAETAELPTPSIEIARVYTLMQNGDTGVNTSNVQDDPSNKDAVVVERRRKSRFEDIAPSDLRSKPENRETSPSRNNNNNRSRSRSRSYSRERSSRNDDRRRGRLDNRDNRGRQRSNSRDRRNSRFRPRSRSDSRDGSRYRSNRDRYRDDRRQRSRSRSNDRRRKRYSRSPSSSSQSSRSSSSSTSSSRSSRSSRSPTEPSVDHAALFIASTAADLGLEVGEEVIGSTAAVPYPASALHAIDAEKQRKKDAAAVAAKRFDKIFGKKSAASTAKTAKHGTRTTGDKYYDKDADVNDNDNDNDASAARIAAAPEGSVEYWNQMRAKLGIKQLKQ